MTLVFFSVLISHMWYLQVTCGCERGGGWCGLSITMRRVGGVFLSQLPAGLAAGRGDQLSALHLSLSLSLSTQVELKLQWSGCAVVPVGVRHAGTALETLLRCSLSTLREVAGEARVWGRSHSLGSDKLQKKKKERRRERRAALGGTSRDSGVTHRLLVSSSSCLLACSQPLWAGSSPEEVRLCFVGTGTWTKQRYSCEPPEEQLLVPCKSLSCCCSHWSCECAC